MNIILLTHNSIHHKTLYSITLFKTTKFHIVDNLTELENLIHNTNINFDAVFSPLIPIDIIKYPEIKHFIFGPQFSIFPENYSISQITDGNIHQKTSYIILSKWVKTIWESDPICIKHNLRLFDIPFPIDVTRFSPSPYNTNNQVFVYFKRRNPAELNFVLNYLEYANIPYKVFDYVNRYEESDYLEFLQQYAKYGIWIGSHESQGYALQEALSCNIPLLVWNVKSMHQEYNSEYGEHLKATTIPYWDDRCGEFFYDTTKFGETLKKLQNGIDNNKYEPRKYVLENLSPEKCETNFIQLLHHAHPL
jgi:hypothetical protein